MAKLLSLGGYCQVAERIQRHTGSLEASPFDWIVTPVDVAAEILRDRGARFALSATISADRDTAVCDHYRNTLYHHEFERDEHHRITADAEADVATLAAARAKLIAKTERFLALLAAGPVILIHLGSWASADKAFPYVAEERPLPTSALNDLVDAISLHASEFRLLHVHHSDLWKPILEDDPLDARVSIMDFAAPHGDWTGDDQQWSRIFNEAELLAASL